MKKITNFIKINILIFLFSFNNVKADSDECDNLLGSSELMNEIRGIFEVLGYVALIVAIILGMLDFFKTIVGGDKADLKQVGVKFVKRLLAVSLFFILPAITEWILELAGFIDVKTCV